MRALSVRRACALGATLLSLLVFPALAGATSTEAEIDASIAEATDWVRAQQEPTGAIGGFGGEWAATALAAAGVDASALRTSPEAPSLQDVGAA